MVKKNGQSASAQLHCFSAEDKVLRAAQGFYSVQQYSRVLALNEAVGSGVQLGRGLVEVLL